MNVMEAAAWLENQPFAKAIAEGASLFPWIESVHVLAIVTVVGTIGIVDLRLLGLASRDRSVTRMAEELTPFTWVAFVVALITGSLLFSSKATTYVMNWEYVTKMCVIVLAGINMIIFQFVTFRTVADWNTAPKPPLGARLAGGISLACWICVICLGRWIGFTT